MQSQNPSKLLKERKDLRELGIIELNSIRGGKASPSNPDDGGGYPPK